MLHTVLVALCAAIGLACFTAGVLLLPRRASGSRRLRLCTGSLIVLFECEIGAVTACLIASA